MDAGQFTPGRRARDRKAEHGTIAVAVQRPAFMQRDLSEQALRAPVAPVPTWEEVAAARQEGYVAGHLAGLAEAAASLATVEAAALESIVTALAEGKDEAARVTEGAAQALAHALVAAMDAAMPDLIRRSALSETEAMLAQVIPGLSREPHVHIEVALPLREGVAALLARIAPDRHANIALKGVDDMANGDVRIRWTSGEARRQPTQVWSAVMDLLNPATSAPKLFLETDNGE